MTDEFRKLVTKRTVDAVVPIENADAIELLHIDGWKVVSKKGDFEEGDECIFFEIDSLLPETDPRFDFLTKSNTKNIKLYKNSADVNCYRLKTIKLRGQISQGLALPANEFPELDGALEEEYDTVLGIEKYEQKLPASLGGIAKGNFPAWLRKTDEERIQNCFKHLQRDVSPLETFEVTTKLDGCSATYYLMNGVFGVCSRNLDLKETEENVYWRIARKYDIENKMRNVFLSERNFAIQGEIIGPGIQDNKEGLDDIEFYVFSVYDIDGGEYVKPLVRREIVNQLGLNHVPVVIHIQGIFGLSFDDLMKVSEGESLKSDIREGVVFKSNETDTHFKIINPEFLIKWGE